MMGISIWHILVVLLVVMLVFGTKRLPGTMEDLAKGLKAFKKGMKDDDEPKKVEADKSGPAKE
ncbi:MAG TPA: twin-arginine translocase TatA/TatE family subunit [Patescibacteria group bacterium]|nr:twin-arginine translocase TatA/TatE family subunit [Patescibacteria group bacterium]